MANKSKNDKPSDLDVQFRKLFWEIRKEQVGFKRRDSGNHKLMLPYAKRSGWGWVKHLLEASRLSALGKGDAALRILAKCVKTVPRAHQDIVMFLRANALQIIGKLDDALQVYRKVLSMSQFDRHGYVWNNIGKSLAEKEKWGEAVVAFRKATELQNDTPARVWNNLGKAYLRLHKPKLAKYAFEKALAFPDELGGEHSDSRAMLSFLGLNLETRALTDDDRALIEKNLNERKLVGSRPDAVEVGIIAAIQASGDTQYEKYIAKPDSDRDNTLSVLRGWSSAVTLLEGSERRWRGGGYFLKWRGFGIVIDPGFDFLRNFHDAKYHGREIDAVVVSHNHPDHNSDLKDIDDLRYELYKRLAATKKPGSQPYVLLWDQDSDRATQFGIEKPKHQYEPVVMACGFPQPINLQNHAGKIPLRITPFKVNHGSDVPHAMGMVLELLDKKGKPSVRIGYTADTAYFPDLHKHLCKCDVLIAHISQPSIEELQDASKLKDVHLGYRGTARLLKECNPKLSLIGEFWAGFTDLRVSLAKGLRQRSGVSAVLPAGLAMHLRRPSLEIECTECGKPTPHPQIKVAPPTDDYGSLAYLCPNCVIG